MTPAEHRAAAEQSLVDAWDDDSPKTLIRALTHAVLGLAPEEVPRA